MDWWIDGLVDWHLIHKFQGFFRKTISKLHANNHNFIGHSGQTIIPKSELITFGGIPFLPYLEVQDT